MVLLGMVPVLMQTPPTLERCSTTTTLCPHLAPCTAARCPAGPDPITIKSYFCMVVALFRERVPRDASVPKSAEPFANPSQPRRERSAHMVTPAVLPPACCR